ADRRGSAPGAAPVPVAPSAVRVRAAQAAHRPLVRRTGHPARRRARRVAAGRGAHLAGRARPVRPRPPTIPAVRLTMSLEALVGRRLMFGLRSPAVTDAHLRPLRDPPA